MRSIDLYGAGATGLEVGRGSGRTDQDPGDGDAPQMTGFARPFINQLFGVHFPNSQNAMMKLPVGADEAWRRVVGYIHSIGLWPAVTIDLPEGVAAAGGDGSAGR